MLLPRSPFFALPVALALGSSAFAQAATTRVSVSSSGEQANSSCWGPSISDDGRFVVFGSTATNLGNPLGGANLYLRDLFAGTTTVVGNGGASEFPLISGDGSIVVYSSTAAIPLSDVSCVMVYDRLSGSVERVSPLPGGTYDEFRSTCVSSNGRFIAYTGFVPGGSDCGSGPCGTVYVLDRVLGTIVYSQPGGQAAISNDGRFVAAETASNTILFFDRNAGLGRWMTDNAGQFQRTRAPRMSRDGRVVVFDSGDKLIGFDENSAMDVYIFDRLFLSLGLLSVTAGATQHNGTGTSFTGDASLSADGSLAVFRTTATNFVPGLNVGGILLKRRDTGAMELVSVGSDGTPAPDARSPAVSANGRHVVFSTSVALEPGDTNGSHDIYVRDRWFQGPVVYCEAKVNSQGCTPSIGSVGSPNLGGADDFHVTATSVRNQSAGIMFWGTAPDFAPFGGGTRCVHAPLIRTPIQFSGGSTTPSCTGSYDFHFSDVYLASYLLTPGTSLYAQWWQRDVGHPDGTGQGLTNALEFTVTP